MNVQIYRAMWDDEKEKKFLEKLPYAKWFKPLVLDNSISLFRVEESGMLIGAFLTRGDVNVDGSKDLVLLQTASYVPLKKPFHVIIHPFLNAAAKCNKCNRIRIHTDGDRKGLNKIMEASGFRKAETVYLQEVADHGE